MIGDGDMVSVYCRSGHVLVVGAQSVCVILSCCVFFCIFVAPGNIGCRCFLCCAVMLCISVFMVLRNHRADG